MTGRIPILYLAPWVDLGGSDKGTIDWFKHLDRRRFAPSLITTQPSSNRWLHKVEPYAEEIWALPDVMPGSAFPAFILGFIESRGVQVAHVMNSRIAYDLLPDMTCLRQPPATVLQFHAEEPDRAGYMRYAAARYGNLVDAFSVTSAQLGAAMRDYDVAGSRIHVIYTGVDALEEFAPERVEPFADLPGSAPRVLWPGRLAEQKDPMLTLEVLRLLRERGTELTLHIVGDGPMAPAVRARAAELGVDRMIAWHPPSLEIARWYRSCDLVLMTSVFEGVPYVIYEALAMGVPVVAPALPGNLELMDEHAGVLVDPRDDAMQYADAIAGLLADGDRRRSMGERSRRRMLEGFNLRTMAAEHEALYDELLERRSAAARARHRAIAKPLPVAPEPARAIDLRRAPAPDRTVAVIVPCYQHGRFLADCIDSIRAQTLAPAQVIVVDDFSQDAETDEALRELDRDAAITVIRMDANRGPSAARNRALREVSASYVLPLDADDLLLPGALQTMVDQLERAPADVGYIYPNPLHFGNRHDYVESPAYNLHLLLQDNYVPATSLFDRRLFDAGIAYGEDIVFGHEDWDIVLQLAEHGVCGQVATGPTFKYRRRGFSRVNAVEYGPESFHAEIRRRHPALYAPEARARIKAEWAPALSIILCDTPTARWDEDVLEQLKGQRCSDFEVLTSRPAAGDGITVRQVAAAETAESWATAALAAARGRWVLVAEPDAAPAFAQPTFVDLVLQSFWHNRLTGLALVAVPAQRLAPFSQVEDHEDSPPCAIAWAREAEKGSKRAKEAELGLTGSVVDDIVMAIQAFDHLQWRSLPLTTGLPSKPESRVLQAVR